MRRFILALICGLYALVALAQSSDCPLKFMGVPVEDRTTVVEALKKQGFRHRVVDGKDVLTGDFNGKKSRVILSTEGDKVRRLFVEHVKKVSAEQARLDYNSLIEEFRKDDLYMELETNRTISDTDEMLFQMNTNKKKYEAGFYLFFSEEEQDQIRHDAAGMSRQRAYRMTADKIRERTEQYRVWFRITGEGDDFDVVMYFDNMVGQPKEEKKPEINPRNLMSV